MRCRSTASCRAPGARKVPARTAKATGPRSTGGRIRRRSSGGPLYRLDHAARRPTGPCRLPRLPATREAILRSGLAPVRAPAPDSRRGREGRRSCQRARTRCPARSGAIIAGDPALQPQALLQAVNSAREGSSRVIGSVERAVMVVGLNRGAYVSRDEPVAPGHAPRRAASTRSRAGPLVQLGRRGRSWAREVSAHLGRPPPRRTTSTPPSGANIAALLIQQTHSRRTGRRRQFNPATRWATKCAPASGTVFGTDARRSERRGARRWGLPDEVVVEPIRYHHSPDRLAGTPHA